MDDVFEIIDKWNNKSPKTHNFSIVYGDEERIVLLSRPYSVHPNDWYLSVVMCFLPTNTLTPYVTWLHNATGNHGGYFFGGHYFQTKEDAFEDWKKR